MRESMKGAFAKGAQVEGAECAVTQDRCADASTPAERNLAEVLADVLRLDHLSVESHFFDELGADSLVMAKFCARVRKRGTCRRFPCRTSITIRRSEVWPRRSRLWRPRRPSRRSPLRLRRPRQQARGSTSFAERCRLCSSLRIPMQL